MDNLGNRMKSYESVSKSYLMNRSPVIIRLDGKSFHQFTRGFNKPFDEIIQDCMMATAIELCQSIQNCRLAYTQSDEISLLLIDYDNIETESWFKNNIQKITSVSASLASVIFNKNFINRSKSVDSDIYNRKQYLAIFDSRVFNLPANDVCNYFIWRQKDAIRNSIQSVSQSYFSQKELNNLSCNQLLNKLMEEKNVDWESDYSIYQRRGCCIIKQYIAGGSWSYDSITPVFTEDRYYIEKYLPEVYKGDIDL